MKQKLLIVFIAFLSFKAYSQDAQAIGASFGSPLGDAEEYYKLSLGLHGQYLTFIQEDLYAGVAIGGTHYIAENAFSTRTVFNFGPAVRYNFLEKFAVGIEGGLAASSEQMEWQYGYYAKPQVGWTIEFIEVFGFYKHVGIDDANISTIGMGVALVDFSWF